MNRWQYKQARRFLRLAARIIHEEIDWEAVDRYLLDALAFGYSKADTKDFLKRRTKMSDKNMRVFPTGAIRDTDADKPNYIRALSPLVLQRYVAYIGKHRVQSDGNLRDWDNWKKGIPKQAYLEGLKRHLMALWLLHEGHPACDNHGPVTIEDALCAVLFNASGYLHKILEAKGKSLTYSKAKKLQDEGIINDS